MRTISFLLGALVTLVLFGLVVAVVSREALLVWSVSEVRTGISRMRNISRNTGVFVQQCREKGVIPEGQPAIDRIQLRFVDDRKFVVEVVCSQFQLEPIVDSTYTLPPYVFKQAGSGGLTMSNQVASAVVLEVWGRARAVGVEDGRIFYDSPEAVVGLSSPVVSCQGYGYECCAPVTTLGGGQNYNAATDCPKTCFEYCEARPVILSVATQPLYNQVTRTVELSPGEQLDMTIVLDTTRIERSLVTVNWGDGTQDSVPAESTATLSHRYACQQAGCVYQVAIEAVTDTNVASEETALTQLQVVVR